VLVITLLNVSARRRLTFVDNGFESMCSSSSRSGSPPTGSSFCLIQRHPRLQYWQSEYLLSKASEIGEGVFGTVYKVPLGTQGRMVAIKKLVTENIIQYPEDFDREVRILGKAKLQNLISLKGYYWTPQTQLLVTEYAANGSLQAKLHERLPSVPPLSWANRFKILLGTAKGLAHLHHSFRPPIIHYNIKPSNILLDENHNPKISDFGLARLLTKLDKHIISNRFQSALGYVAPELACQSLRVNEKCDVYGFGVMILELVTGRRPVEYGEDNVVILSDHVRVSLEQGNVLDCVDPSMSEYPEDEVLPVLKLALVCTLTYLPAGRQCQKWCKFCRSSRPQFHREWDCTNNMHAFSSSNFLTALDFAYYCFEKVFLIILSSFDWWECSTTTCCHSFPYNSVAATCQLLRHQIKLSILCFYNCLYDCRCQALYAKIENAHFSF
jgi:serine/threonine protein kinase